MLEIFFLVLNIQTPPPFSLSFVSFGGVGRRRNRRYLFYTFGVLKSSPYPLFFLRYSLFFILYPTGIIGETMTMWAALPDLEVCTKCFFTRLLFGISFFFASFVPEPASEEPTSVHLCLLISHSGFPLNFVPPERLFPPHESHDMPVQTRPRSWLRLLLSAFWRFEVSPPSRPCFPTA